MSSTASLNQRFEIYFQNPRYEILLEPHSSMFDTVRKLHEYIKDLAYIPLELIALSDSSHDFNQTVHLTLDYNNLNTFWSSLGSETSESTEDLVYQIRDSPWLISSVMITAFQAKFHTDDPIYPPRWFRVLVGFVPNKYHYASQMFKFEYSADDQYFSLLPDLVFGKYIKIEFYGKVQKQEVSDEKYYIALQKVWVNGWPVNTENMPSSIKRSIQTLGNDQFKRELDSVMHESNNEEHKQDILNEEEFELFENHIIRLTSKEITFIRFCEDNKIDDIMPWVERNRIVSSSYLPFDLSLFDFCLTYFASHKLCNRYFFKVIRYGKI